MVEMDKAFELVVSEAQKLKARTCVLKKPMIGDVLAENLHAQEDFPTFHASTMDGYAIQKGPKIHDRYQIKAKMLAGKQVPSADFQEDDCIYITTGA